MSERKTTPTTTAPWDKDNPKPAGRHRHLGPQAKAAAKRRAKAAGRPYPNLVDNMRAATEGAGKAEPKRTPSARAAAAKKAAGKQSPAGEIAAKKALPKKAVPKKTAAKKTAGRKTAGRKTAARKPSPSETPAEKAAAPAATARRRATSATSVGAKDPQGGLTAAGRAEFARKQGAHLKPGVMKPESEMSLQEMRRKGSWATRFYGRATLPPLVKPNGEPTRFALSAHAWGEKVPKTEAAARRIAEKGRKLLARYQREKEGKSPRRSG